MVATLGDGLGAQAAQTALADRRALERRLDDMAQALNGMEGALRIELTPHLRQMMDEAVATVAAARPSRWRRGLTLVAVLAIGVAVGTAGSHEISAAARAVTDRVAVQFTPAAADGPRSGASVGGRID